MVSRIVLNMEFEKGATFRYALLDPDCKGADASARRKETLSRPTHRTVLSEIQEFLVD